MPGGKILILLFILLLAVFAMRFLGTLPIVQQSPFGLSSATTTSQSAGNETPRATKSTPTASSGGYVPQVEKQDPLSKLLEFTRTMATSTLPKGFARNQLSPYFYAVVFSSVSRSSGLTLSANFSGNGSIDVSGWAIRARHGGQTIPKAVNIYDPLGVTPATDIYLKPGDKIYMFPWASAVGENFRINKCIGYLANQNAFRPTLPRLCAWPSPSESEASNFTSLCQDYLSNRVGTCRLPDYYSTGLSKYDYACQDYFKRVNFKGCFESHAGDKDFLRNEIWVWTGNDTLVDSRHDRVILYDNAGLYVSEYSY